MLFSTPMVQALLANTKTQTRRIVDNCRTLNRPDSEFAGFTHSNKTGANTLANFKGKKSHTFFAGYNSRYGKVGDILWVRETFLDAEDYACSGYDPDDPESEPRYSYKADCPADQVKNYLWKPSLFMPYSACRIFLKITDIRIERLNEISKEDAIAEGIVFNYPHYRDYGISPQENGFLETSEIRWAGENRTYGAEQASYRTLWESINGKDSWSANPYVWVVSFERTEKPATV